MAIANVVIGGDRVVIGGDRVVIFVPDTVIAELPWRPNEGAVNVLRYTTDVIRARDGTEHRRALLTKPRRTLQYQVIMCDDDLKQFRAMLRNDTDQTWKVPLWHECFVTTADIASGTNTATADFTLSDLATGQLVYIQSKDQLTGEFQTVGSVTSTTLTLQSGSWENAYSAGARIFPAVRARVADNVSRRIIAPGYSIASLDLEVTDFLSLGGAGATLPLYQGLPILSEEPRDPGVEESAFRGLEIADFGGVVSVFTGAPFAELTRPLAYQLDTQADRQRFKLFFDTVLGRREPFYVATWQDDLNTTSDIIGGELNIEIDKTADFQTRWFNLGNNHKDLQFDTSAGVVQRRLSNVTDNGNTLTLTLDAPLPGAPITVAKISFLELVRLASDEIRYTHFDSYSLVEIGVQTIEQ